MSLLSTLRAINWRIVSFLATLAATFVLASMGWGILVHWLAHCS